MNWRLKFARWLYRHNRYAQMKEEVVNGLTDDWWFEFLAKHERAAEDIGTLMGACIDYRNTLARAYLGDPVSGRHGGVEEILEKYNVVVGPRKMTAPGIVSAYIRS